MKGLLTSLGLALGVFTVCAGQSSPMTEAEKLRLGPNYFVRPLACGLLGEGVPEFWVRPGYKLTRVATGLRNARFMEFDDKGHLFLSRPERHDILVLAPNGRRYEVQSTFVEDRPSVHGLTWANGWMYYTMSTEIRRAHLGADGKATGDEVVLNREKLTEGGGHWWRSILVTSDSIYTSIGDPGNVTDQTKGDREKIWRFGLDGSNKRIFVGGIRNTEKLRLRPGTNEVWGCDHGSDNYGEKLGEVPGKSQPITDMNPPEEVNLYREGEFYGHPFLIGNRVPRFEYSDREDIVELAAKTNVPQWCLGAHWAVNGFTFLTKNGLGADFKGDMVVAAHGSWNSRARVGYRVERVIFDKVTGRPCGNVPLVYTLTASGKVLGRPVDVVEAPDGSILFSDDFTNSIYRLELAK